MSNINAKVVEDFGYEWSKFNYQHLNQNDLQQAFQQYFHLFPFERLHPEATGFDMGCGSGRWAKIVAQRVGKLYCIDASHQALNQAKENLKELNNCEFECASVSHNALPENSQDFGYCLGVLHHIPDTLQGLEDCVKKLKKDAPFLLYLYYRFDNKPLWYKCLWHSSDYFRRFISKMPRSLKLIMTRFIALTIYWPLAKLSFLGNQFGMNVSNFPLSDYRNKSFYFMKTDALDRFGTRLEKRFTKDEIRNMMIQSGLRDITFSHSTPYWVALGYKK